MRINFQSYVNSFSEELLGTQKQKQAGQKVGEGEVPQRVPRTPGRDSTCAQDARQGQQRIALAED